MIKKDEYSGKKCFIVGSGPSLAYKNLSFLRDYFIIALNLSILTLDLHGIKPDFNIIADKYQYLRFKEVYKKLTHNKDIKKIIVASACETFPKELADKETFFFQKKLQQEVPTFSKNPIKDGFSRGKTVAYDAIQLAYYSGFKEVNIIGMDMDFNKDWGINGHSYEIEKNVRFPNIKFAKNDDFEIQRGSPGHPEYLPYIEDCMRLAKKAFESKGRKVFNDKNSKLKVFPKKDFLKDSSEELESKLKKEIAKYDYLFSNDINYNSNPNHERFIVSKDFLSKLNIRNVLDVGVGKGHFFKFLDKEGYKVNGVEPSKEARELLKDKRIFEAYSHSLPFNDNEFDVVVCLDVLEHIPKELILKSIREIKRVTKKHALISVAHHSDIKNGWELHISSMPFKEWKQLIKKHFIILSSKIVSSKSDKSKVSEVYLLEKENHK